MDNFLSSADTASSITYWKNSDRDYESKKITPLIYKKQIKLSIDAYQTQEKLGVICMPSDSLHTLPNILEYETRTTQFFFAKFQSCTQIKNESKFCPKINLVIAVLWAVLTSEDKASFSNFVIALAERLKIKSMHKKEIEKKISEIISTLSLLGITQEFITKTIPSFQYISKILSKNIKLDCSYTEEIENIEIIKETLDKLSITPENPEEVNNADRLFVLFHAADELRISIHNKCSSNNKLYFLLDEERLYTLHTISFGKAGDLLCPSKQAIQFSPWVQAAREKGYSPDPTFLKVFCEQADPFKVMAREILEKVNFYYNQVQNKEAEASLDYTEEEKDFSDLARKYMQLMGEHGVKLSDSLLEQEKDFLRELKREEKQSSRIESCRHCGKAFYGADHYVLNCSKHGIHKKCLKEIGGKKCLVDCRYCK